MAHGHGLPYDPFGRRYSKETSEGQKEIYIYDGLNIIEVYDGNTMALKSSFVHSDIIDEVLFGNIQGQDVYYHQDGLNSVKKLTDGTGTIIGIYDYDAWGNPIGTLPSIANPFTYTGREWDKETGLYYYRARYYTSQIGRFISEDPIGFDGGINFYAYVGNNPVNFMGPLGLLLADPNTSTGQFPRRNSPQPCIYGCHPPSPSPKPPHDWTKEQKCELAK